jgi:hypothetical protein
VKFNLKKYIVIKFNISAINNIFGTRNTLLKEKPFAKIKFISNV